MRTRQILTVAILIAVSMTNDVYSQSDEFKYQGNLVFNGQPANGNFDFEFRVFGSSVGGTQFGNVEEKLGVAVTNGTFAVSLLFEDTFDGNTRFLEIRVRPAGSGSFTTLTPRELIGTTPYAMRSANAFQAQNAVIAETAQTATFAENAGSAITAGSADFATNAANATNATNATNAATASNSLALGGLAPNQYVLTNDSRLTDARPPTAGSTSYIQNSASPQASSNFNISGIGTIGGRLILPSGTAAAPSLAFGPPANDGSFRTGIYRGGNDTLNVSTAGVSRLQIDDSGNISIPATTRYLSISGGAFQPETSSMGFWGGLNRIGLVSGESVKFWAPITLPHGANVTEIKATVLDNDSNNNITVAVLGFETATLSAFALGGGPSVGTSPTVQFITDDSITNPTIDNQNKAYMVTAQWVVPPVAGNITIYSVRITYTVSSMLP